MKKSFIILFFFLFITVGYSQTQTSAGLNYLHDNFYTLVPKKTYSQAIGQAYNNLEAQANPDFGTLPYNAPQKNVVEVLAKRTVDERYYVDIDDPTFFYIQKSAVPINFNVNGNFIAIDPTLEQVSTGVYAAPNQPHPTKLDVNLKKTVLSCQNQFIENNRYTLSLVDTVNVITTYTANWSNYTVGNNGAYITDIFPGVDMKIFFAESKVKSNFIIKNAIANCKRFIFTDHLGLSSGLSLAQQSGSAGQLFKDGIDVKDASNNIQFVISKAKTNDASGDKAHSVTNPYRIIANDIQLHLDSTFLNLPGLVYPVIVDPLFTAVGPIAGTPNTIGSLPSPAFCSQNITVTFPGGSTPWDVSAAWNVGTIQCCANGIQCWRSDAQLWLTSSCGGASPVGSPGTIWVCNTGGCFSSGNWNPTLPFASSGTQSMAHCYPASCTNQNLIFTINLNRTFCANSFGCNCSWATNVCVYLNSWNVTVQGRTMETLANSATGNGSTTQAAVCYNSTTMNPNPQYGITPLSYLWGPGGQTSSTLSYMPTAPGNSVFTCTVTDACGTTRVATFTITNNCVLPIELKDYTATYTGNYTNIKWSTATEKNAEYFTVERSSNGVDYILLEKVPASLNSTSLKNYGTKDYSPNKKGTNYYRLKQFDVGNKEKFSKVITVDINEEALEVNLVPNPASTDLDIELSNNFIGKTVNIELYDVMGKKYVLKQNIHIDGETKTTHLNLSELPKGIFFINVITEDFTIYKNKLIKL